MPKRKALILAHLEILRESDPPRFWALVGMSGLSLFGMVAAFAVVPDLTPPSFFPQQQVVEQLALPKPNLDDDHSNPFLHDETVRRGDTIGSLLNRMMVNDPEALSYLSAQPDARRAVGKLYPGQTIWAATNSQGRLISLTIPAGDEMAYVLSRTGSYLSGREQMLRVETQIHRATGTLQTSLFAATDELGLPDSVATSLADIFGSQIDFHSGLARGDRFGVVYEVGYYRGQPIRAGRILAAEFQHNGKIHSAILYRRHDGKEDYFDTEGRSLRRGFLRSPLAFSRVSSGFSMRMHPVLNEWRAHKGVDFSAPTGTPVKATADGVITSVGSQGGYGNLIVLRHNDRYTTVYGHLSAFAAGMQEGRHVSQGDLIGFVGSTGWATGPHLHYEFRVNGNHVDPLSIALPNLPAATVDSYANFRSRTKVAVEQLAMIRGTSLEGQAD